MKVIENAISRVIHSEIANYCSPSGPSVVPPNATVPTTFSTEVNDQTPYTCINGYQGGSGGVPYASCNALNSSTGIWAFNYGSCVSMHNFSEITLLESGVEVSSC